MDELGLLVRRSGAQLAEQIDGGRECELGCAEAGDEIATANAAAFFEGFKYVIDSAESAGDVFRGDRLAQKNAVAVEQLKSEGVAGFGGG